MPIMDNHWNDRTQLPNNYQWYTSVIQHLDPKIYQYWYFIGQLLDVYKIHVFIPIMENLNGYWNKRDRHQKITDDIPESVDIWILRYTNIDIWLDNYKFTQYSYQ